MLCRQYNRTCVLCNHAQVLLLLAVRIVHAAVSIADHVCQAAMAGVAVKVACLRQQCCNVKQVWLQVGWQADRLLLQQLASDNVICVLQTPEAACIGVQHAF